VWKRPDDEPATPLTVCPGAHVVPGAAGPCAAVWWDPHALDLAAEPAFGIRRETLIMKDVPASIVADGLQEYTKWRTARADAIARGSTPSIVARTATEWAASGDRLALTARAAEEESAPTQRGLFDVLDAAPEPQVDDRDDLALQDEVVIIDARGSGQAGGARFGELVHATLAVVPLDADRPAIAVLAEVQGRILAAPAEETAAAAEVVERILSHELLRRARSADAEGRCRRETPVTLRLADGTFVEGVVDLAFVEAGIWTVVDYKTDREIAESGEAQYRRQVALYVAAIARATGQEARGVLIRV